MTLDDLIKLDATLVEFELSLSKLDAPTPEHWHILNRLEEILRREKAKFLIYTTDENPVKRSVDTVNGGAIVAANNR